MATPVCYTLIIAVGLGVFAWSATPNRRKEQVQKWYGRYHTAHTHKVCRRGGSPIYAAPDICLNFNTGVGQLKEKTMANAEQYRAVLDDLLKQRHEYQFKIGEIDAAVAALSRLMPNEIIAPKRDSQQSLPIIENGRYAGMSNRWAILQLLSEDALGPMTTGQIAEALQSGGIITSGKSFAGNVSAVLSKMLHERKEIESTFKGWKITELGKQSWIHIKGSRQRNEPVTEDSLTTVQ